MTGESGLDPRIAAGMKAQLAARATRIAGGAKRLGWKAGFGAPAALDKMKLAGPLVGYMLADARVPSGDEVSVSGWVKPVAEPEIAVLIGEDLLSPEDEAAVRRSISGVAPAIELADLDPPPEDVTRILSGNIFHRRVLFGRFDAKGAGGNIDGLAGFVTRKGQTGAAVTGSALEANTGRVVDVVAHMGKTLIACGEKLQSGDVVICGSVVPPLFLDHEDKAIAFRLYGLGEVSVKLTFD